MSAPRFAALGAGLIVRKGEAVPSAPAPAPPPASVLTRSEPARAETPRGEPPRPALVRRSAAPPDDATCRAASARIKAPEKPVRAEVRLDPEQARRFRLAGALLNQSHQAMLNAALDAYLDRLGAGPLANCGCMRKREG